MTSSSRTNVKIKFPSPAGMIDDGKGKHRFQGKARKQPGNAWKWEMLTVQSSTGSDPAPYGVTPAASLCCSSPLSILAFVLPREGCPSPWPLGMSSLPLFLSPRCTLWDCEVFRSFPQKSDLKSRGASSCSRLHRGNSCPALRGFASSVHQRWSCSHRHLLIIFNSHFPQLLAQLLRSPNSMDP